MRRRHKKNKRRKIIQRQRITEPSAPPSDKTEIDSLGYFLRVNKDIIKIIIAGVFIAFGVWFFRVLTGY